METAGFYGEFEDVELVGNRGCGVALGLIVSDTRNIIVDVVCTLGV